MTPQQDETGEWACEHGTALDVHCCNCHSGFLFDVNWCVCILAVSPVAGARRGCYPDAPRRGNRKHIIELVGRTLLPQD